MKDISIIMLAHNRPVLMQKAIMSALSQKDVDFEFILVNKSIDEKTHNVCVEFAEKYPQIKHIKIPPGNIGVGRNAGIEAASGKYITFVDDDDYFDEDMMGFLLKNAKKVDADISICGCYNDFGGELRPYYIFEGEYIFDKTQGVEELLKREKYNSANPCKLFKKELFENVSYATYGKYDDIHTIYKLFAHANIVIVNGTPKYYFLKHESNNSGFIEDNSRFTSEMLFEYLNAFKLRTEYLSEKVPSIISRIKYSEWSYMLSMLSKIKNNNLEFCDEAISYMKEKIINDYDIIAKCDLLSEKERNLLKEIR